MKSESSPRLGPDDEFTHTDALPSLAAPQHVIEIHDEDGVRCVPVQRTLRVGSDPSCDVRVQDACVSRAHCELRLHDGELELHDLDSKNGCYVGGSRVWRAVLAPGAVVVLGSSVLSVRELPGAATGELLEPSLALPGVAGQSQRMLQVARDVRRLAALSAPVLVRGETGTGKELVARALHELGPRAAHAFVPLNVASLPRELVESELFGHERGAFTGAVQRRLGAFAEAAGGTVFLDEIGELPADAQPKLLRVLDGYEVRRVGGSGGGAKVNARVVAATHVALESQVEQGGFRRDLFHRLEVCVIDLPPLRERRQDVPAMAKAMLLRMQSELGVRRLTSAALGRLIGHRWPGNARELRNVLYRAALHAGERRLLDSVHIERALSAGAPKQDAPMSPQVARAILREHHGNLSAAARAAGLPRTSFRKRLTGQAS